MAAEKVNLMDYSIPDLREFFVSLGEKPFRCEQILRWVYQFGVTDFALMSNLRKDLREKLQEQCELRPPVIADEQHSVDGTVKWALRLSDDKIVETVLIPEEDRNTLCISTQVGCPVGCAFCRTGALGFGRNLRLSEIIGQVFCAATRVGFSHNEEHKPISNVVMMGMGEPLYNLKPVLDSVQILLSDFAFALSKRRVTISTAGVAPIIEKIAGQADVALALSLHAPTDELRNRLVPLNAKYPLKEVLTAVRHYLEKSNANCGRVTIEYVLLSGVNDSLEDARALCSLLRDLPCKINLIPFNEHECAAFKTPNGLRVERFFRILADSGFTVMRRTTRGADIAAACGQLAGKLRHQLN